MNWDEKWKKLNQIGQPGGQGTVYRVINKLRYEKISEALSEAVHGLSFAASPSNPLNREYVQLLHNNIIEIITLEKPENQGALKILHSIDKAHDPHNQKDRIKNEIQAMMKIHHPHLLKIIDSDINTFWYVSEYHPNGTLEMNAKKYKGNAYLTLYMIRPIVEGITELHKNDIIHRDIKPQNIFINSFNKLILGDFGLVFFTDSEKSRISETYANVGSWQWMAPWTQYKRVNEINPSFDIFPIAKVIWSMISGKPHLPFWYFDKPENDLVNLFPNKKREMKTINLLLSKCIVENENKCLKTADQLLNEIDFTIDRLESKYDILGINEERMCKVCGKGTYILQSDSKMNDHNFGLSVADDSYYLIFICNHCGNTQLFFHSGGVKPDAWKNNENI